MKAIAALRPPRADAVVAVPLAKGLRDESRRLSTLAGEGRESG